MTMASTAVRRLLESPSQLKAEERALKTVNELFPSIDQVEQGERLRTVVEDAKKKRDELQKEVG